MSLFIETKKNPKTQNIKQKRVLKDPPIEYESSTDSDSEFESVMFIYFYFKYLFLNNVLLILENQC